MADEKASHEPRSNPAHPIAIAIDNLLHRAKDIKTCTSRFIPEASRLHNESIDNLKAYFEKNDALLKSPNSADRIIGISAMLRYLRKANRLANSRTPEILETSLFVGLFSSFDAYIGHLLLGIYKKRPELFKKSGKEVAVSDVLQFSTLEEFIQSVIEDEIETFRRKSYIDQFTELEGTFQITLRKFDRWPQFVECAQRRNLFTHCDGIVSSQYLKICAREGFAFLEPIKEGDKLELGPDYFLPSIELIMEVGLKLGQTLWRKLLPDEMDASDKHLNSVIYDALHFENWDRARVFGEFAISEQVSKRSSDLSKKMFTINLAIAMKFDGDVGKSRELLLGTDWTAAQDEFKLAEAVLNERYEDAGLIMRRIGVKGAFLEQPAYHSWPLFKDFRQNNIFLKTYEEIYGHPFSVELSRTADAQEKQIMKIKDDAVLNLKSKAVD